MRAYRYPALALLLTLAAAGCGEPDGEETSPAPTFSQESTPTKAADPFAPNLGDRALKVGARRVGDDMVTMLHEVKYPLAPAEYRDPDEGKVFVGLSLEQCAEDDIPDDRLEWSMTTYNGEWSAVTPSGEEYAGSGSSWNDWPSPKFPEATSVIPGRCVKGWLEIQVPEGIDIESFIWRPGGQAVAEWIP